jgi:hypothetical protein
MGRTLRVPGRVRGCGWRVDSSRMRFELGHTFTKVIRCGSMTQHRSKTTPLPHPPEGGLAPVG